MAQQEQTPASKILELLKDEIVGSLSANQRIALCKALKEDGMAMNPDIDDPNFNPSEEDKSIMIRIKSPLFKKSCFKKVTVEIERDGYLTSFTKDEWEEFQKAALEIAKS